MTLADDGFIQRNGPRQPMHRLSPAEHAAMGWAHGQYKDGYCTTLMCEQNAEGVAEFKAEAAERGAVYVALRELPEYKP